MAAKVWQVWQPLAGAVKALPTATAQKLDLGIGCTTWLTQLIWVKICAY